MKIREIYEVGVAHSMAIVEDYCRDAIERENEILQSFLNKNSAAPNLVKNTAIKKHRETVWEYKDILVNLYNCSIPESIIYISDEAPVIHGS